MIEPMRDGARDPVATLVGFGHAISGAEAPREILPRLAEAAVEHLGVEGAAVLEVAGDGRVELAGAAGLPEALAGWSTECHDLGPELERRFLGALEGRFQGAHSLPLVGSGNLYGVLFLLWRGHVDLEPERRTVARALAEIAALALDKAFRWDELRRSHEALRASREALARGEKLRALGQMAAGISHDVKNLLNPLFLQVELLRRGAARGDTGDKLRGRADEIEQVLRRGLETVERLRLFSRDEGSAPAARADLGRLAGEAVALSQPRAKLAASPVTVELSVEGAPHALVEPAELVSVVLNLITNAIEATGVAGGRVTVTAGEDDRGVFVAVADTGPGIPPEVQAHLFEPFFTTKGTQGTGLGLSMAESYALRHGGTIEVASAPGEGARFTLRFPPAAG
jgi:signal transduction histidine kinase